jgi:hypothetical protein
MDQRGIAGLITALALAACSVPTGNAAPEPVKANPISEVSAQKGSDMSAVQNPSSNLPTDACTQEGYWSFFEAFAQSQEVRDAHTADAVRSAINPFRISLVDDRWFYVDDAGKGEQERQPLELKDVREGNAFRVEYVRAEFDANDEIVKTYGTPGSYVFNFVDGCWQLTQSTE